MDCDLDRIRVHYEELGSGRPVLVLHGTPIDHHETVFEYEPHFSGRPGWRRLYVDLPGSGETLAPEWVRSRMDILDVLDDFIEAVIHGERLAVVGTSTGAYLARGLARRHPDRVLGLLLSVPVIEPIHAKRQRPPRAVLHRDERIAAMAAEEGNTWLERIAVVENESTLAYARALHSSTVDEAYLDRLQLSFDFNPDDPSTPLLAPTLIITGRQDNVVGYRDAWAILDAYPQATFVVLDRAGHMALREREQACASLIADWLDQVEARAAAPEHAAAGDGDAR